MKSADSLFGLVLGGRPDRAATVADATVAAVAVRPVVGCLLGLVLLAATLGPHAAAAAGCTFDNEPGIPVPYHEIVDAGQCAQAVMGAYYPTAVYCDKQLFITQGWQGCFTVAGIAVP